VISRSDYETLLARAGDEVAEDAATASSMPPPPRAPAAKTLRSSVCEATCGRRPIDLSPVSRAAHNCRTTLPTAVGVRAPQVGRAGRIIVGSR
jgi:hypothetical protein